jgi:mannosyltransferase
VTARQESPDLASDVVPAADRQVAGDHQLAEQLTGGRRPGEPITWAARAVVYGVPAAVAFSLGLWQVGARSFSQDEGATLSAARRSVPGLFAVLAHIDAVHGAYYLVIHFVITIAGASETAVRLPSVLAAAVAAGTLAALGTRLAGQRAGFAAGLLFAVAPPVAADAQNARPFALATALAVITCYRFIRYAQTGRRRDAAWYAVALALSGWFDVLTLLVVIANAATLAAGPAWRPRWRGFALAAAGAGLATAPLIWLDLTQVKQVAWERPPGLAVVGGLLTGVVAGAVAFAVSKPGHRGSGPAALVTLAAPWLLLPPVLLAGAAQITPMWQLRYLLFCLPAAVLLIVAAASLLPVRYGTAVLAVVLAAALAGQSVVRPAVATDDIRAVSRLLGARARPGDAVVFGQLGRRLIMAAYPAAFTHLRDIGGNAGPAYRDTLYGKNVSQVVLDRRLASVSRFWLIQYTTPDPARFDGAASPPYPFCALRTWQLHGSTVTLYLRCTGTAGR